MVLAGSHTLSALHGPAWPESRGFGLACAGSGFVKPQAKPKPPLTAWLRLGLAQAAAFVCIFILFYFTRLQRNFTSTLTDHESNNIVSGTKHQVPDTLSTFSKFTSWNLLYYIDKNTIKWNFWLFPPQPRRILNKRSRCTFLGEFLWVCNHVVIQAGTLMVQVLCIFYIAHDAAFISRPEHP